MTDTIENGVYLRDGKPLYTQPGDNDRAVAAHNANEEAKVAPDSAALTSAEALTAGMSHEDKIKLAAELEARIAAGH